MKTNKPKAQTQHRKPNRWATRSEAKTGGKSKLQRKQLLHRIMSLIGREGGFFPYKYINPTIFIEVPVSSNESE
jgi:hypothetical protein